MRDSVSATLKEHFWYSIEMLGEAVSKCPFHVWERTKDGHPYWQIVLHILTGLHYWTRNAGEPFDYPFSNRRVYPELDALPADTVTPDEMQSYFQTVKAKVEDFLAHLSDEQLNDISDLNPEYTNLDLLLCQIRHIQHHLGACNTILKENGAAAIGWRDKFLKEAG